MMLDPDSALPLYHQLKSALRRSIDSGVWSENESIPTERELIEQFGVSRITVRQAISDLVAEGILYRRHGKGTYVSPRRTGAISERLTELTGHVEELQRRGLEPQVEILGLQVKRLPVEVAEALRRPEGTEGWWVHRRIMVGNHPLMVTEAYVPTDLNATFRVEDLQRTAITRLLEEVGHLPAKGKQRIGAQRASPEDAQIIGIKPGDPVLRVERVITGRSDVPLEWSRTLYRSDRYEYEVELSRRGFI